MMQFSDCSARQESFNFIVHNNYMSFIAATLNFKSRLIAVSNLPRLGVVATVAILKKSILRY